MVVVWVASLIWLTMSASLAEGSARGFANNKKEPTESCQDCSMLSQFESQKEPAEGGAAVSAKTKLSHWGIFTWVESEGRFVLDSHHVPYELKTPLFSDYADKFRTLYIPDGNVISLEEGRAVFPKGTIISKTFSYRENRLSGRNSPLISGPWGSRHYLLETRVLFLGDQGWEANTYVWDSDGRDATRKAIGARFELTLNLSDGAAVDFSYRVPNLNQCQGCHIRFDGFERKIMPIGPTHLGNLDRELSIDLVTHPGSFRENQLVILLKKGWLRSIDRTEFSHWSTWDDPNEPLASRVRSYLAANCAHCHNARGPAATSGLYLGLDNSDPSSLGVCKAPVAAGHGSGDRPYDIVPGSSARSIMPFRMGSDQIDIMMPELGKTLVHHEAVELVEAWIDAMSLKACRQ